jgi:hypothetical protein
MDIRNIIVNELLKLEINFEILYEMVGVTIALTKIGMGKLLESEITIPRNSAYISEIRSEFHPEYDYFIEIENW